MRTSHRFALAALGLAGTLAYLSAEVLLRLVAVGNASLRSDLAHYDLLSMKVEPHGRAGYRPKPDTQWRYANGAIANVNAQGFRGPVVPTEKRSDVVRIVLLGGSTSFGWGVDDDATIDAALRTRLALLTGQRIEVINAAFDGYDSFQLLERMRSDVVRLRPDLVIINAGINDVRGAEHARITDGDPRTLLWRVPMAHARELRERGTPRFRDRVQHHSYVARFVAMLRDRLYRPAVPEEEPLRVHWDAADYFERNIRRLAAIAARHGAAVVLSTPPSSLRERHAPTETSTISYWAIDARTTADYRDTLANRLERVATDRAALGDRIDWVRPRVTAVGFLDDAHLTREGNDQVAAALADAAVRVLALRVAEGYD